MSISGSEPASVSLSQKKSFKSKKKMSEKG